MQIDPERLIVVLTGAGISVESGLPVYRGQGGLWEGWRLEEVATPEAFARHPETVQRFYNERRRRLLAADVRPNEGHRALARLEREWPGGVLLVTQNVDDLHERAGSRNVLHMHGELFKIRCDACETAVFWQSDVTGSEMCASCGARGTMRPHVVWFGEMPLGMERIGDALRQAGLFLAVGTSGQVYPAAGFVREVRALGEAHTIEVNPEASAVASAFAEVRRGPASREVPMLVGSLLANGRRG